MATKLSAPSSSQLQPLNLPPLKVHELSTPTARKVNTMSQKLQAVHLDHTASSRTSSEPHPLNSTKLRTATSRPITPTSTASAPSQARKPSTGSGSSRLQETQSSVSTNTSQIGTESILPNSSTSTKSRESGGLFNRLSLSRSSSVGKAKKRLTTENGVSTSDGAQVANPTTPERPRRLSISWMKGKMSPFSNSPNVPRIDSGIPPTIPKSYTSESISSLLDEGNSPKLDTGSIANTLTPSSTVEDETVSAIAKDAGVPGVRTVEEVADSEMRSLILSRRGSSYLSRLRAQASALEARAVVRQPVGAIDAVSLGGSPLNLYEKGEIIDYDGKVFFTGQKGLAKSGGRLETTGDLNFGYDDERGDYLVNPGDHFAYRYEIVDILGKGSFGQVLRCVDYKTGGLVAVKVIRNKKRFHAQALVEVNILQRLRAWDPSDKYHLIKYTDHFYFRHHLCIATDLLGMNLYEYIKANDFKGCTLNIIRSFTTQILECLLLLKRERVIHCDLKPENILLVNVWESKIKIIDFGSSCFEDQKVYTYIQSRFYRSPEVILGMSYGIPIDMWSMGCILAELFTGFPIFPGEDEQEQLACIMEVFGPPEKHLIENSTRKKLFFDSLGKPRTITSSKGRKRKPSSKLLSQATKCSDEAFLDFLTGCLRWNPQVRMSPEEAQNHPFITGKSMKVAETPKVKRLFSNQMTHLPPRPLPQLPQTPAQALKVKGYSSYRSASTSVVGGTPHLASPSKVQRRVVSNLPLPRGRVAT